MFAAEALPGFALSQAINSAQSFAGIVFLAKRTAGIAATGEISSKLFSTSYGSEYKAAFSACGLW